MPLSWPVMLGLRVPMGVAFMHGSSRFAARLAMRSKGWGGTGLLTQTPIRHTSRAIARTTHDGNTLKGVLPSDYNTFSWHGPGARKCLDFIAGRKLNDNLLYAPSGSQHGRGYLAEMESIHEWLLASNSRRSELEAAAGRSWGLHETQVGLCFAFKYNALRDYVLFGVSVPAGFRWRKDSS